MLPELRVQIPADEQLYSVYANGVYDTKVVPRGHRQSGTICSIGARNSSRLVGFRHFSYCAFSPVAIAMVCCFTQAQMQIACESRT